MRRFAFVLPVLLALACGGSREPAPVAATTSPLLEAFATSATNNHVPRDLLVAIAAVEDGLEMPLQREVDPDATIPVAGPLQLRRGKLDTLRLGAELMGTSELAIRADTLLGLEAGARVLAELGRRTGARLDDLASWSAAIEELGGYADEPHRREYAHRVFGALARGDGHLDLAAHELPSTLLDHVDIPKVPGPGDLSETMGADYPGAEWFPTSCTNKCTPTRSGNPVQFVVVHDTEGGWDASVSTLQNDPNKSVHYIIGTDGRLGQFVNETVTAWHAGNFWYNQRSVGIEHVGYSTKPYTEKQYAKSAELLAYLTKKYGIAKDRAHVIGHDQIPNGTIISESSAPCSDSPKSCEASTKWGGAGHHTDPGVWEWCTYMPRFGGTCKCNDIWELWNCSYDKTKAFRCVGGKIELQTCDGPGACEVQPLGTPDICHTAPTTPADAGTKTDAGGSTDAGPVTSDAAAITDGGSSDGGAPAAEGETDEGGSCSTTPGLATPVGGFLALVAALAAMRLARRR